MNGARKTSQTQKGNNLNLDLGWGLSEILGGKRPPSLWWRERTIKIRNSTEAMMGPGVSVPGNKATKGSL